MKMKICSILVVIIFHVGSNAMCNNPLISDASKQSLQKSNEVKNPSGINAYYLAGIPAPANPSLSYTSKAIYLSITPSTTSIVNSDINGDNNWNVSNGIGVNVEVGYLTKFNEIIGIGFGAGYSSYSTELKSNDLDYELPDVDIDGDNYSKDIATTEITEKTNISYFDIPVFLELSNTNVDKIGFYSRIGVKISFPLSKTFTSSGSANYEGYYDQYHVHLYDIPELGFTQKNIYQDPKMELNTINLSASLSAGITIPVSSYFIVKGGINANWGLIEISGKKADDYDQTRYDGNYSKLLENPNAKTSTRSFGVEIGLIYNLRLY